MAKSIKWRTKQLFLTQHHKKCINLHLSVALSLSLSLSPTNWSPADQTHSRCLPFHSAGYWTLNVYGNALDLTCWAIFMCVNITPLLMSVRFSCPWKLFIVNCLLSKFYDMDSLLIGSHESTTVSPYGFFEMVAIKIFGRNKNRHHPLWCDLTKMRRERER